MAKYNPPTLLGDGAYKLVSATVSGVLYEKWTAFWDAKAITAPWVEIYPMTWRPVRLHLRRAGSTSSRTRSSPTRRYQALNSSQYGHYVFIPPPYKQESLVLHLADYPLGILQVRQALEYVIQRDQADPARHGWRARSRTRRRRSPDGINDFDVEPTT